MLQRLRDNVAFWLADTAFTLYPIRNAASLLALPSNVNYYLVLENF